MRHDELPIIVAITADQQSGAMWRDREHDAEERCIANPRVVGALIDCRGWVNPPDRHEMIIPMVPISDPVDGGPDDPRLIELASHRKHIAVGRGAAKGEWCGTRSLKTLESFIDLSDRIGYEWYAPLTHRTILEDMARPPERQFRQILAERQTPILCLCAYVIMGYLHGDPRVPHQGFNPDPKAPRPWWTSLSGRNLYKEFGLTYDRFVEYIAPLNIYTGCGGHWGVEAGTPKYAAKMGFKGLVIAPPFDMDAVGDTLPRLDSESRRCGIFNDQYHTQYDVWECDEAAVK